MRLGGMWGGAPSGVPTRDALGGADTCSLLKEGVEGLAPLLVVDVKAPATWHVGCHRAQVGPMGPREGCHRAQVGAPGRDAIGWVMRRTASACRGRR